MSTTVDTFEKPFIKREHFFEGTQWGESTLAPSVLPMTGFSLEPIEQSFWLVCVKKRGGLVKGGLYRLDHIHNDGRVQVSIPLPNGLDRWDLNSDHDRKREQIRELFPMDTFAMYVTSDVHILTTKERKEIAKGVSGPQATE